MGSKVMEGTGSQSSESGFRGPDGAGLQVHSFTPTWPRTCASAAPVPQLLLRRPPGQAPRLWPKELALGQRGNSSSRPSFRLHTNSYGHPEASWSFRALFLCQGSKRKKKKFKKQPPAQGYTWIWSVFGASGPS